MVVRSSDSFRDLFSKRNIKIPCQCYYNAKDNLLTEIIQLKKSELINPRKSENSKALKAPEKKDAETETPVEHCCVCEYYRGLEKSKNKKDLWNMQLNRWWGWNWQRRRKDFLSKFKPKCVHNCTGPAGSQNDPKNVDKNMCFCDSSCQTNPQKILSSYTPKSCRQKTEIQKKCLDLTEPLHPMPPITTYGFRKPYTGRRKRNKDKQRLYEGWVREVTSSDSDNSIKSVKIKMKCPEVPSNNKDYMKYLSLRFQKFNSEESLDFDVKKNDQENKKKVEIQKPTVLPVESQYVSPISGKYYNFNQPEISVPFTEINDTEYLNPVDIKDETIIPKLDFNWSKHYNLLKEEHSDLLKSIRDVLCSKFTDLNKNQSLETEKEIRNFDYTVSKILETNNCNTNIQAIKKQEIQQENYFQNLDLQIPKLNSAYKSEIAIKSTNPFYDYSLVKSLTNNNNYCSKSINLPSFKQVDPLLISKSSNLFYEDAVKINENKNVDNHSKIINYDINYISNNLQSFASSISDTEFLICQTENPAINITEEMSEKTLQEVDLFN